MTKPTSRAMATALRTYHRPIREGDTLLESWDQVVDRVVCHQRWLWERALGRSLNEREEDELEEMRTSDSQVATLLLQDELSGWAEQN